MDVDLFGAVDLFAGRRVLVLGDVIADVYLEGEITRISREAPVMILEYAGEQLVLGGAGNAAANLQSLGGRAVLAGVLGDDGPGRSLRDLAVSRGIEISSLLLAPGFTTCTKTRIVAAGAHTVKQQILRVDRLPAGEAASEVRTVLEGRLAQIVPAVEAVILSDYGLGTLPTELYQAALRLALRAGRPVVVDSRHRMGVFPGATLLTPNVAETEEAVGRKIVTEEDLIGAGWSLMARLKPRGLLITRGPDGMSLFLPDGSLTHIPAANRQEVFDVSGAGDTVVAAAALGLAAGLEMLPSARLANFAAGVVVRKMGTAAVTPEELRRAIGKSAENGAAWPIAPAIGLGARN